MPFFGYSPSPRIILGPVDSLIQHRHSSNAQNQNNSSRNPSGILHRTTGPLTHRGALVQLPFGFMPKFHLALAKSAPNIKSAQPQGHAGATAGENFRHVHQNSQLSMPTQAQPMTHRGGASVPGFAGGYWPTREPPGPQGGASPHTRARIKCLLP